MCKKLSFREAWQAMLRGCRICKRRVTSDVLEDLRFWAKMSGRKIFCSGNQYVLSV